MKLTWQYVVLILGSLLIMAGCEVSRYYYGVGIWQ